LWCCEVTVAILRVLLFQDEGLQRLHRPHSKAVLGLARCTQPPGRSGGQREPIQGRMGPCPIRRWPEHREYLAGGADRTSGGEQGDEGWLLEELLER